MNFIKGIAYVFFLALALLCSIGNRLGNGYEIVRNIKVVSIDRFEQLEVASKVDYVIN